MERKSVKVLISMPPAMVEIMDNVAKDEHRTRSELMREALRRYVTEKRAKEPPIMVG